MAYFQILKRFTLLEYLVTLFALITISNNKTSTISL